MDWICDDEDYEKAEMAEDDLQQWAVNPFLPIFNQVESSLGSTTLHTSRLPFPGAKSARKVLKGHTIYSSASLPSGDGLPLLTDFGEARLGDEPHSEDIMPNPYRAPEAILNQAGTIR